MFKTPVQQMTQVKKWNKKYKWGFKDFPIPPDFTQHDLTTLVLVPYFETVSETVEKLWQVIADECTTWRNDNTRKITLIEGIAQPPKGLKWEKIDLGAHHKLRSVSEVRDKTSAHAGVLAAAVLFPNWVKSMDGVKVPYVDLAGYEIKEEAWSDCPYLIWWADNRRLHFHLGRVVIRHSNYAAPVVLGESSELGDSELSPLGSLNLVLSEITVNGRKYRVIEDD